jgi:hypothetical protein
VPDKSYRKVAEGVWQFVSDPEDVRSRKKSVTTLSGVIRKPPIDPLIESEYVRAVDTLA